MIMWKGILKQDISKYWPNPDNWYEAIDNIRFFGMLFGDYFHLGRAGGESIWYFIEKPWKWTPEYTILYDAGIKLNLDPEELYDYMDKNSIYSLEDLKKHIEEK
tara:strand:- start:847 stop:1158 length:312 start_codon:yes stop_codon:yes gene_type:complete